MKRKQPSLGPVTTGQKQPHRADVAKRFQPGQSGNPAGRPRGSRHKLSEEFVATLAQDFDVHGAEVITTVRKNKPDVYLRIVAELVPKDFNLKHDVTNPLAELFAEIDGKTRGIPTAQS